MKQDYMAEWKKNSIRIGAPTCSSGSFYCFYPRSVPVQ